VALQTGTGTIVRERWFSYDGLAWGALGTRGLLTREERRLTGARGTAGNPATTTGYDAYGNVSATTDAGACTTTTAYDAPAYAVPTSVTTCLGHVSQFGYDAYARRTSVTDPNTQVTRYAFDAVGRLTRITGPLDTASAYGSVTYQYATWGTPTSQTVRTLRTRTHGQAAYTWTYEYFDGTGRVYHWRASGPAASQVMAQTREFDGRGWVTRRTAA
jgi:YD repeat-containing protein